MPRQKKTKEEIKEYKRLWAKNKRKTNDEFRKKELERCKIYHNTYNGKKSKVIAQWKYVGIKDEDFESLYKVYLEETNCWICGHNFSKYFKCLDHDHKTGEVRYICCQKCNTQILNTHTKNQYGIKLIEE